MGDILFQYLSCGQLCTHEKKGVTVTASRRPNGQAASQFPSICIHVNLHIMYIYVLAGKTRKRYLPTKYLDLPYSTRANETDKGRGLSDKYPENAHMPVIPFR